MADHTIAAGQRAVHDVALVASVADTIEVDSGTAERWSTVSVEILSDGTAAVYVTVDGTVATVGGSHCYKLPASGGYGSIVLDLATDTGGIAHLSLVSAGTPTYSVTRVG